MKVGVVRQEKSGNIREYDNIFLANSLMERLLCPSAALQ